MAVVINCLQNTNSSEYCEMQSTLTQDAGNELQTSGPVVQVLAWLANGQRNLTTHLAF